MLSVPLAGLTHSYCIGSQVSPQPDITDSSELFYLLEWLCLEERWRRLEALLCSSIFISLFTRHQVSCGDISPSLLHLILMKSAGDINPEHVVRPYKTFQRSGLSYGQVHLRKNKSAYCELYLFIDDIDVVIGWDVEQRYTENCLGRTHAGVACLHRPKH